VSVEADVSLQRENLAGELTATVRQQLRAASALHAVSAAGRCDLYFANARERAQSDLADAVRAAADTAIARLGVAST
jgi:hypothetical protein